jgi:hypothetical protein
MRVSGGCGVMNEVKRNKTIPLPLSHHRETNALCAIAFAVMRIIASTIIIFSLRHHVMIVCTGRGKQGWGGGRRGRLDHHLLNVCSSFAPTFFFFIKGFQLVIELVENNELQILSGYEH